MQLNSLTGVHSVGISTNSSHTYLNFALYFLFSNQIPYPKEVLPSVVSSTPTEAVPAAGTKAR